MCSKLGHLKKDCWHLKKEKTDEKLDQALAEASIKYLEETTSCQEFYRNGIESLYYTCFGLRSIFPHVSI